MPIYEGNIEQSPASHAVAITPDSSNNFPFGQCRAIYVGATGDVYLDTRFESNILFKAVPVGILPVAAVRVRTTSTASSMVALY